MPARFEGDTLSWLLERDTPWGRMSYIEYRRKVGVHADWRKFAHRFPQVRGAFERYRDGKATSDDCYLIARILKNQMAANGMKVNPNIIGKISHGTVDDLVARMLKSGLKPYLLRKPR